jgi:hypothetical protein
MQNINQYIIICCWHAHKGQQADKNNNNNDSEDSSFLVRAEFKHMITAILGRNM